MHIKKPRLYLSMLSACACCALLSPLHGDSAIDSFIGADAQSTFKDNWKPKFWAAKGAGPTGTATLQADGLRLVSDAQLAGQPSPGFSLANLSRQSPYIRTDKDLDLTLKVKLSKLDVTPYGTSPAGRLVFGIAAEKSKPAIFAKVGMVRAAGQMTLHLEITAETGDEQTVIVSETFPGKRIGKNTDLTFDIQGETVDFLLKGKSLINGPIKHNVDLGDPSFASYPMKPQLSIYKLFGKKGQAAIIQEFEISGESVRLGDNDIIGDQLGSTAFLAEPVFTVKEALTPEIGEPHTIARGFFGINGNLSGLGSAPWDNEGFSQGMRDVSLGHMRYPAGTIGNYWDWNIGWLEQDIDSSQFLHWTKRLVPQKTRYTLEDFAKGQREVGFEPVFMLNMVTRDLEDQLKQLHRAKAMGMPIQYVELGNEYYFGPGAEPLVHVKFPTPESYAEGANKWAAAIKRDFPEAQVAAVGTAGVSKGTSERRETWNARVAPMLSDDVDAMTMHPYSGIGMFAGRPASGHWGNEAQQQKQRELLQDPAAVQHAILTPTKDWLKVMSQTQMVDKEIWATEFNTNDWFGGVRGTWTQTIALGAAYDGFLRDKRVQMATLHNAVGTALFAAVHPNEDSLAGILPERGLKSDPWSPTACGLASKLFADAGTGRDQATPIDFGAAAGTQFKGIDHNIPMVRGWIFSDSKGEQSTQAIVINFTPEPVTVQSGELAKKFSEAVQTTSQPDRYIATSADVEVTTAKVNDTLTLAPYSFTLLK
ncbi:MULTISPECIES: hypothetical protein [unclassified Lentimonas]|uniref:hypothetical protein n=1 Tax=unclassified Lentimonas TaxID=2630993 RepID=UPI00132A930F|nr:MULTISPECIES: hypothetical protein [unclassified Lentimonas]CAA6695223.1 Unannotated [Lentimonas sp. CC19]CAA6697330.1 Unannotated [Lentimonas sp. CC10]CAA7070407.1 Unannotated [Lentimonas sp. CC11]